MYNTIRIDRMNDWKLDIAPMPNGVQIQIGAILFSIFHS